MSLEEAVTRVELRLDDALGSVTEERYRDEAIDGRAEVPMTGDPHTA